MKNDSQAEIRRMIDDFAAQLEATLRRSALEQVLATLQASSLGGVRRGPGRPRGSGAKRGRPLGSKNKPKAGGKRGRRSTEGLEEMQSALLSHVKSNPGQRGEQIAAALGTDVGTMRLPMKKLIAARQVRTEGQRRGMMYFAGAGKAKAGKKKGGRRKKATA
jgi:hypothetical protein